MVDTTDEDYTLIKRVSKNFEIKKLREYHDLYVQRDALFPADLFNNFRNMYLEIYELELAHFLSAPGLAWQPALKGPK